MLALERINLAQAMQRVVKGKGGEGGGEEEGGGSGNEYPSKIRVSNLGIAFSISFMNPLYSPHKWLNERSKTLNTGKHNISSLLYPPPSASLPLPYTNLFFLFPRKILEICPPAPFHFYLPPSSPLSSLSDIL
jgi:hypothetical protein